MYSIYLGGNSTMTHPVKDIIIFYLRHETKQPINLVKF